VNLYFTATVTYYRTYAGVFVTRKITGFAKSIKDLVKSGCGKGNLGRSGTRVKNRQRNDELQFYTGCKGENRKRVLLIATFSTDQIFMMPCFIEY